MKSSQIQEEKSVKLQLLPAAQGSGVLDVRAIHQSTGCFTFDPGFASTASCESKITYIDGGKGQLQYRGYPIEVLARESFFEEVCYLLFFGELPTQAQLDEYIGHIREAQLLPKHTLENFLHCFDRTDHPMSMLMSALSLLAGKDHASFRLQDAQYRTDTMFRLLANMPILVSAIIRYVQDIDLFAEIERPAELYSHRFVDLLLGRHTGALFEKFYRAMEAVLTLHADHEQNASTSAVRVVGSTESSPYASISAGIGALWGPSHGGANEAVVDMLEQIQRSGNPVTHYIDRAKDKDDSFRLMGFGHRVYKNYDPRARIVRHVCLDILSELDEDDPNLPLLEIAQELEAYALKNDYFIERKLYPNVDFYSGIIFKAMQLPKSVFTLIFALSRTIGWISHWNEMVSEGFRISRPRQLYSGSGTRAYIVIDAR